MPKYSSPKLELRILRTICAANNHKISSRFLALDSSFFSYDPVVHALERIQTNLRRSGSIPSLDSLAEDPILSDGDRLILTKTLTKTKPIKESGDADVAFTALRTYRVRRKLHAIGVDIQKYLEADDEAEEKPDLDVVLNSLGNSVASATVSHFDTKQILWRDPTPRPC